MKLFQYILITLLAVVSASCIDDNFVDEGDYSTIESKPFTGKLYVDFNLIASDGTVLHPSSGSRGEDDVFEDGSVELEQKIGTNGNFLLLFRPDDNIFFALSPIVLRNVNEAEDNIEHRYSVVLDPTEYGFEISEDDLMKNMTGYWDDTAKNNGETPKVLANCLVILNAMNCFDELYSWAEAKNHTLDDVLKYKWIDNNDSRDIGRDSYTGSYYFTMSNSIYINRQGKLCREVPITIRSAYETTNPASKEASIPATIYIERMLAKATFDIFDIDFKANSRATGTTESGTQYVQENSEIYFTPKYNEIAYCTGFEFNPDSQEWEPVNESRSWRTRFTGWNVNALEKQSYLFKNINENGYSFFNSWNDPANYRSYWAEDPDYSGGFYPWQFRSAINIEKMPYDDVEGKDYPNTLRNLSYNEISATAMDSVIRYFPEHTYDHNRLFDVNFDNRVATSAGTHLIVTAELETDIKVKGVFEPNDLYRDRNGVFYSDKRHCMWALLRAFNHELNAQTIMEFMWYDWSKRTDIDNANKRFAFSHEKDYKLYINDDVLDYDYIFNTMTDDELESYFIPATVKDGDGKLMIWIPGLSVKDSSGNLINVYDKIEVNNNFTTGKIEYRTGNAINYNEGNNLENTIKSVFYEWVGPVDHFSDGKMYYYAPMNIKEKIYGAVRNNWYKFNLLDLQKIGTSVDIPDQPIIPNKVYTRDQLNISVDILDWHTEEIFWNKI